MELDWTHKAADIARPQSFDRRASEAQCAGLTALFGDAVCRSLRARYEISPVGPGHYVVTGRVRAAVEQTCGVTLDPIEQAIDETFRVAFRSDAASQFDIEPDFDTLADDDPEPIENGALDVGRLITEIIASALDPFPRAGDAELERTEAGAPVAADNPFAVLGHLKRGKSD